MRRSAAAVGSAVFFVVAPGVVAGLVPWLISGWQLSGPTSPFAIIRMTTGAALLIVAVVVLVRGFARFVGEGGGTPAPVAPTERLVVGGDYRFVRNPMYLAVVTAVLGQAMIFGSLALLLYALTVWAIMAVFVHWYEEPVLLERYGEQYQRYRQAVPAWVPRLHPWHADIDQASNGN
ncbi:MAG TPA: isoprenylcysteine carboxylmethyltransferase family protein [Propionibacteriaceae bacterium]|nr:isoprenylcysteine carboxylmethyltransferase family protein [Propionibacteriaceae bacterium]